MAGPHAEAEAEVVGRHDHPDVLGTRRLHYAVVTPRGAVGKGDASEIIAPGFLGEVGLLAGHIPFLAALKAGILSLVGDEEKRVLAVGPGYLQVGAGDRVQILVETAARPEEIDADEAQRDLDVALAELKEGAVGAALEATKRRLEWAQARLAAKVFG